MKFNKYLPLFLLLLLVPLVSCSVGGTSTPTSSSTNNGTGDNLPSSGTLSGLAISPGSQSVSLGSTATLKAIGSYSDNTTKDLTSVASWSSSSTSVATINTGIATPVSIGTTTITAKYSTFTAVASLTVTTAVSGSNVMTVTVNGSLCSSSLSYPNKPCVSVKICEPGSTTACKTVTDLLLDTGSVGLRIFSQALTGVSLTPITSGSDSLAECVTFLDGSAFWGPVQQADVYLGGEQPVTMPIQILDATFATVPSSCGTPDTDPTTAGMNGILGVGINLQDCGSNCVTSSSAFPYYYFCSSTACTSTTVSLANQVQNPVAALAQDNNGVILQLPAAATGGVKSADGNLIFGIDTQSNNSSSGATAYPLDAGGYLSTTFNGNTCTNSSFIDSGSNGLFFPPSGMVALCSTVPTDPYYSWYCPTSTTALTATITGNNGTPSSSVPFSISNSKTLFASGYYVFSDLGAAANIVSNSSTCGQNEYFDWGLPFFLGRNVYLGFEGKSSSLGTGPYNAF